MNGCPHLTVTSDNPTLQLRMTIAAEACQIQLDLIIFQRMIHNDDVIQSFDQRVLI